MSEKTLTEEYVSKFSEKTPKSREIWLKLRKLTPYGVHSNWRVFEPHPLMLQKAKGSRVWDVDGNEYIDYTMAFGALVVGHANPVLLEKVKQKMDEGTIYGYETELSCKLSEVVTRRYGFDMVRFSNTGSEGTLLAIRLARVATGRSKILKFEGHYHGSHELLMVGVKPDLKHAGHPKKPRSVPTGFPYHVVPKELAENVVVAPWNDAEAIEEIMKVHGNDIAAIIMEPVAMNMGVVPAKKDFMVFLRKIANEYNSLLIFDEVKTSGMWYRGAQEYFGVKPDIMVAAKAIGGGFPFAAVLASKELLELVGPRKVPHGGTFNANPLSVYAAYVTLTELLTESNLAYTHKLSEELAKGYRDIIEDKGFEAHVVQVANKGTIYFSREEINTWRDFVLKVKWGPWYVWTLGMVIRGIIPQAMAYDEQWTISIMHTRDDIQKTLEVANIVAAEMKGRATEAIAIEESI
ncbi:aspartate aminotransferase family protein [Thermosphaera chiliense]|uniref:Aspartate aminotransferase family protein n=1 Tax=Thermosphaera chiliense TaxID=3402707 RepID=A0A7M1UPY7_9CREN|nr:aspartate aminotransferase family protein [Thermosphaera aggregans]QOR94338.1 aspartate aminotransferase family protein [Thermosphaera aggregans]